MKQTCKRILSLALCLLLCAALLPGAVWAAEIVASGTCGANLTWTLDSDGKLTISGTGKMEDYTYGKDLYDAPSPWLDYTERNAIKTIVIRDGATSIGDGAFYDCSSLTSVTIPDSVTSIGDGAFYWCSSLTSVTIPNSITSIGDGAFFGCNSLTSVTIPNSVTSIGESAFYDCSSLTSVTIPNSVTSIGGGTFSNCSSLTSVTIPSSVTSIGFGAFQWCTSLTSVSIPNSVTSIDESAFSNCSSLTSVTIPNSVTSIGVHAFDATPWLQSLGDLAIVNHILLHYQGDETDVTIPNSVTSIGDGAFEYCTSLKNVTIPNSVTSIGRSAFYKCTSLTSVSISNSVTSIGFRAFSYCTGLKDVYFTGTEQEWRDLEMGEYNDALQNAAIHFNSTGPSVVLSPQNLTVNGVRRDVEKYNIDGYNYFKLRDIACLLNGTPAQFSVDWDAENNAARIVSGQPYTANGSELVIGADRSATAVRSPQTIVIDGEVRSDLAAFNLAGNNFFKLRDLGEALGFQVDYDAATNTAVVTTG